MKRLIESLSTTNDGAFIIDEHFRIVFWNQAAEELLGYTSEEAAGKQCYEILGGHNGQDRTFCQLYCMAAIQTAREVPLPNRDVLATTQAGEGRWLNVTTFVYSTHDQSADEIIVHLFRDATKEKNNERFVDRVLKAASEQLQPDGDLQVTAVRLAEPHINGLTAREVQVLELLARGLGTEEVASTLVISSATVRNHVQNILSKLGVHSRLEAIAFAYQQGLIEVGNGRAANA